MTSDQIVEKVPLRFYPLDYASMVGFLAYASTMTATPICLVAISRELSLSLSQAGGLEAMRGILIVVTLLFSGFIGAKFGKVRALGWSSLVLGAGMVCYSVAPGYGALLLALAFMGLGGGVVEALINPLVQELHPKDSGRYLNLTNAFWSVGILITVLGSGELLSRQVSWRAVIAGIGGLSFISGVLFLLLRRTASTRARQSFSEVFRQKRAILGSFHFWLFASMMFLGGASEGAFTYWGASLIQLQYGGEPRSAGFGLALFAIGMIVARLVFGWALPQSRLWALLMGSAMAGIIVGSMIPLLNSLNAVYIGLLFSGAAVASFWPSMQAYAVDRLPFDPTGIFILLSCGGIGGFASIPWVMGAIGDRISLRAGFWVVPICLLALAALLVWERVFRSKDRENNITSM